MRDAATGAYLSGFEAWDQIEGALAHLLRTQPLRWLGPSRSVRCGGQPVALRLTPLGQALLAEQPAP